MIGLFKEAVEDLPIVGKEFSKKADGENAIDILFVIAAALGGFISIIIAGFTPISDRFRYNIQKAFLSARFSLPESMQIAWRQSENPDFEQTDAVNLGYNRDRQVLWQQTFRPRISDAQLLILFRRGELTVPEYFTEMRERGWINIETRKLIASEELVPGAQDLIRMMVREVFDPDQRQALQLDADFPAEAMAIEGGKIGLTEKVARDFWAAHWNLPSITQAFQFRHRLRGQNGQILFSAGDLDNLLKAQDISPAFRAPLIAIAFQPLTRIDIRRAFKLGKLDEDGVRAAYRDIGYDGVNLEINVAIAMEAGGDTGKDLSQAVIKSAYKKRRFTREVALSGLVSLGFDDTEADIILDLIDFDIEQDRIDDVVDVLEIDFVAGEITEADFRSELTKLGLESSEVEFLTAKNNVKRVRKIKKPTDAMLSKFYRDNIITAIEYEKELENRGWNSQRISWIRQLLEIDIQEDLEKIAERARKEQERLQRREESTAFQLAKAARSVSIAEFKLEIADLKVAANSVETDEEIAEIKEQILMIKAEIAQENLSKAEITQERFE